VSLFVAESVNRHCKELYALLEINIDVRSGSTFYVKISFSKCFLSSFVRCQRAELINYAEVILVIAPARCWHAERPLASVRPVSSIPL
jgi:hypothetical protein